jgi:molybdate transport system substrate-binding protein
MKNTIRVISSMATKHVLNELAASFERQYPYRLAIESVGGVVAANRVRAGEAFDVVVLAADGMDKLAESGKVMTEPRIDLARSGVAVCVRKGAAPPDISSEAALKSAIETARSISYSTGPSGVHLQQLFERWGMTEELQERTVQAPAGVPVASLVADGKAELGFQQLSEMIHLDGIDVVGPLPDDIQIVTIFSAALAATASEIDAAGKWLGFLTLPEAHEVIRRNGMTPAG